MNPRAKTIMAIMTAGAATLSTGCSTMRSVFATESQNSKQPPIQNPFLGYSQGQNRQESIVLRTKKGDRSVEVELPASHAQMSDFVVPVSPQFNENGRGPASTGGGDSLVDERYRDRPLSLTDRELTHAFPSGAPEDMGDRREVETGLGLVPSEDDPSLAQDKSYLGAIDHVKQLYKAARYEAALLEIDELLRVYPTDPKLYEMRGTLLDRTGRPDLALRSWNQSLRLAPDNSSLKRFVDRKQRIRSLASPEPKIFETPETPVVPVAPEVIP